MKKFIIFIAIVFCLTINIKADIVIRCVVWQCDGGEWGYNSVKEWSESFDATEDYFLDCFDPGDKTCDWANGCPCGIFYIKPDIEIISDGKIINVDLCRINQIISDQINSGITTGMVNYNNLVEFCYIYQPLEKGGFKSTVTILTGENMI